MKGLRLFGVTLGYVAVVPAAWVLAGLTLSALGSVHEHYVASHGIQADDDFGDGVRLLVTAIMAIIGMLTIHALRRSGR